MSNEREQIENFRKAMGTLPSQKPEKNYDYKNCLETIYVNLTDFPTNPFKPILRLASATWGDGQPGPFHGSTQKWEQLTPENRYRVVLSALTGNTLPTALETIDFTFEFHAPRHTFDQFARARLGCGHGSIGSRDNNKLDSPFVLYPNLYKEIKNNEELRIKFENWVKDTKDLYEIILGTNEGSWQSSRAVLPMCYNHSWVSYFNLLSLKGQMSRRLMACEEAPIVLIFWRMREEIKNKVSPLIANYMRPACDGAKRCIYHEGPEGLTKFFSSLFAGCGRHETDQKYSEFNNSCTDYEEISKYVEVIPKDGWKKYTFDSYNELSELDKKMFEQE